jgi:hypothetical protein
MLSEHEGETYRDPWDNGNSMGAVVLLAVAIRLHAAEFDPLVSLPDLSARVPAGPALRSSSGGPEPAYLIQLEGPLTPEMRRALELLGATVLGEVPRQTLLVRADPARLAELHSVAGVRWIGPLLPAYKLSHDLLGILAQAECSSRSVALDVLPFRGEEIPSLIQAIVTRFPEARVAWVREDAPARLTLDAPRSVLDALTGALARDAAVEFLMPRPELRPLNDQSVWIGQSYDRGNGPVEAAAPDPKPYSLSAPLWTHGLVGNGQIVAVADTGLERRMCFFDDPGNSLSPQSVTPPAPLALDLDQRKLLAYNAPHASALSTDDAFRHGTHTSGSAVGDDLDHLASGVNPGHDHGDGMAPGAKLIFEDISGSVTSSCSTTIVVDSIYDLFEQEYKAGARISTNSFGSADGFVLDSATLELDAAAFNHDDFAVFVAAGNEGTGGVGGLALCKNCVSVGASETYDASWSDAFGTLDPENMAAFSSRGPTPDGRIKPDVTLPGFSVDSSRLPIEYHPMGDPACNPGPGVCPLSIGGCYRTDVTATCTTGLLFGTSMSSPLAAGLAALARQYFTSGFYPSGHAVAADSRIPSAALLKALLINGARNMTGHIYERRNTAVDLGPLDDAPSLVQGWGRVMLDDALYFTGQPRRLFLEDRPAALGLHTAEMASFPLQVTSSAEPLKLTLVWADAPGQPLAAGALVNDLDLVLQAPGGIVYHGNQWIDDSAIHGDKRSAPNATAKDDVNNVEGILLPNPPPGVYQAKVQGADIPSGAQGFALVVTGALASSSAPPPVPDGIVGTPLRASRANLSGSAIQLQWDVTSCPAAGYHLLYGPLSGVAAPTISGAKCALGTSGSYSWSGVPSSNLWFLLVGDDANATEGSWGLRSDGTPIGGNTASGLCGFAARDNAGACAP